MKPEHFLNVIDICSEHHSTELIINHVPDNGQVKLNHRITIKRACAGLISKLVEAGFSLTMREYGLEIDKL